MSARPSVLFLNQHYWPDLASTGQHLTDLAEHLAARGFEVHVLTGAARYLAGALDAPRAEVRNGVHVRRLRTTAFGRGRHLGRLLDYAGYYGQVMARLLAGRRYDLVVALTTPPLLGFACALARALRGRRYAIWSMDLHPDAEEAAGMLRPGSPLARLLHALNDRGYRAADLVVDLGPYMAVRLRAKGVRPERLVTLPVWSRADEVRPCAPEENPLRRELGLEGKFVVMYSGNAGLAHRFEEVLEVMRRLRDHPDVYFLFVGDGPRRAEIERFIAAHTLPNARYLDYFPRERLADSLPLGDVHLLTLRDAMAGIAVPGKLYGVMAAGRPVVVVGPGRSEPAETTRAEGVGLVVDTQAEEGADALERALLDLHADPDARRAMGERARTAFLARYEQAVVCEAWAHLLTSLVEVQADGGRAGSRARVAPAAG